MADRDSLDLGVATHLATGLTTVGHPRSTDAIAATALDLIDLCKGALLNGVSWSPEQQAQYLVHEVRVTWADGWPERGGTAALYSLFHAKFSPRTENRPFDADATPEQKAAWRAQYGEPDPAFPKLILSVLDKKRLHGDARKGSRWESLRDSLYYTEGPGKIELDNKLGRKERDDSREYWRIAMDGHVKKHPEEVAAFRLELEQHGWEALMAFEWAKGGAA